MNEGCYLAEVRLFAGMFVPRGWMACEGQVLKIVDNESLFSLVGTTYGGDGRTTFGIPNLKGKEPVEGSTYIICVQGLYPSRN